MGVFLLLPIVCTEWVVGVFINVLGNNIWCPYKTFYRLQTYTALEIVFEAKFIFQIVLC